MSNITPGALSALNHRRLALLADFSEQLNIQEIAESELNRQLVEVAPVLLRGWLVGDGIMKDLFDFGNASRLGSSLEEYGIDNNDVAREVLMELRVAWHGVVAVTYSNDRDGEKLEVRFTEVS